MITEREGERGGEIGERDYTYTMRNNNNFLAKRREDGQHYNSDISWRMIEKGKRGDIKLAKMVQDMQ